MLKYEFIKGPRGGPALAEAKKFTEAVKKEIFRLRTEIPRVTTDLAQMMANLMAGRVLQMTKREGSTGVLAGALRESVKLTANSKGQIRFDIVTDNLPVYWAMINYGGFVSQRFVYGFWSDGHTGKSDYSKRGGVGKGEFIADGQGHLMMPRSAIKGFHYIAFGYSRVRDKLRNYKAFRIGK